MFIIGITGSLATGKSTVAELFKKHGAKVINADRIAHEVIGVRGECFKPIIKYFGRDILDKTGKINRRRLAAIVFKDKAKLKRLEEIIHPQVQHRVQERINRFGGKKIKIVLDVPLLFEAGWEKMIDMAIVVVADPPTQLKRAQQHFGMTTAEALSRIKAQMPLRKKIRLADFIIDNNGTKKQTEKQVNALWQRL